jgi:Raf kinase inhibitor-like YbhB/YbcL family protein
MSFRLTSPGFGQGERIADRFTCVGANVSPALAWTGQPEETRGFAVLCDDPDAPGGLWRHWAVYEIPAAFHGLPEGLPRRGGPPLRQARNDFGQIGYDGPCPPPGHGDHHYRFRVLALSVPGLGLGDGVPFQEVERAAGLHALAEARLVGLFSR